MNIRPATLATLAGPRLRSAFARSRERTFTGFALDEDDFGRRFAIEILLDGEPVRLIQALTYDPELRRAGFGDGCYGFEFSLPAPLLESHGLIEARLANLGTPVGAPLLLRLTSAEPGRSVPATGSVRWLGGLRLNGWVRAEGPGGGAGEVEIQALVDGEVVSEGRADSWAHLDDEDREIGPARAFDLYLPARFADGRSHRVEVRTAEGRELSGSPVPMLAFEDGLLAVVAGRGKGEDLEPAALFDELVPMSWPLVDYEAWVERFPLPPAEELPGAEIAVVLVGEGDVASSLASLERHERTRWVAASIPPPLDEQVCFDAGLLSAFLSADGRSCEWVVICLAGTIFHAGALGRLVGALAAAPEARVAYGDMEVLGVDGHRWPLLFPAFDQERMLEQGYCAYLFASRRSDVAEAVERGAGDIYRLFGRLIEGVGQPRDIVVHVPGALGILPPLDIAKAGPVLAEAARAHLGARGLAAKARPAAGALLPAARILRRDPGRADVSVVIPTRNRMPLLKACIASIEAAETRALREIIVVDNDSTDPETLDYLNAVDGRRIKVLRVPGPFNYSRLNNLAVAEASGAAVCLLNNDTEVLDRHWLDEMLGRLVDPRVGAVGPMLVWPSGVVQHGGVVLGPGYAVAHAFHDRIASNPGYADLLRVAHECSAVTAACLLTRRADYLELGGLDEASFPITFNDVDYCLRLRARGLATVFTPHTRLLHLESATRGPDRQRDRKGRARRELAALRARWGEVLANDPYYSPALSLDEIPFSGLAWPPRSMAPRLGGRTQPVQVPAGF